MPDLSPEEIALLFRSALPIDGIDQVLLPGQNFAVIWVDLSERPDLQVLGESEATLGDGFSICTWASQNPGKQTLKIGLRIEMRQPVRFVLTLAFSVREYREQLETMSRQGNLWIVPGPPPAHLEGSMEMDAQEFMEQVYAYSGQGLFITLQDHLVDELRQVLAEWKRVK